MPFQKDLRLSKIILLSLFLSLAIPTRIGSVEASQSFAAPLSAADLIQGINHYRAQHGLPAFTRNSHLMSSAKDQSQYMAASGTITHSGSGGTSPRDRAYAAGYGGGATIWISEIIYGGYQATESEAIAWWKTSQIHNDTMLSSRYRDIGAGVAKSGKNHYYTVVVGIIEDGSSSGGGSGIEPPSAPPAMVPVEVAEPREDGSIVHVVREGQSLWLIAFSYEVPLGEILELNGLTTSSILHAGDEILIKPPEAIQETATATAKPSATLTPTHRPSPSATPTTRQAISSEPDPASSQSPSKGVPDMQNTFPLPLLVQALGLVILLGAIGGFLIDRRRHRSEE